MGSFGTALQDTQGQDWAQLAAEYGKITAHTNSRIIGSMLASADNLLPFASATGVLDNGCGPGSVMKGILEAYDEQILDNCSLMCADFSEPMLQQVEAQKAAAPEGSPWKRVRVEVQNAMDLTKVSTASVSHVTAGMVYFMTPDPMKCLTESRRVPKDGGVLVLSAWHGSQWMDLMFVLKKFKPELTMPSMPKAWMSVEGLEGEMKKAGFQDVEAHHVPCEMLFQTHESLVHWIVTKLPHMMAMTKEMSEEELHTLEGLMVEEAKKMDPKAPGVLHGVALVSVGRK